MGTRRSVTIALAVGLSLTGITIIAVLAHSPLKIIGTNSIPATDYIELTEKSKLSSCQTSGTIPQGTSAIRVGIEGLYFSPAVTVKVISGSRILREGHRIPGGASAPTVTVPVRRLASAVSGAQVCVAVGPAVEPIRYYGIPNHSPPPRATPLQQAILHISYLRPSDKPWWSFVSSIGYHMGLGRAPSGSWVAILVLLLMLVVILIVSRLTLEELR